MKRLTGFAILLWIIALSAQALFAQEGKGIDKATCSFDGKKLYGRIQVVTAFPDVKVQVVTAFPDLAVQRVRAFPDACGKWQIVTAFPDTKVQFVTAFPDVKIRYVNAFPGLK